MKVTLCEKDLIEAIKLLLERRGFTGTANNIHLGCSVSVSDNGHIEKASEFFAQLDLEPKR